MLDCTHILEIVPSPTQGTQTTVQLGHFCPFWPFFGWVAQCDSLTLCELQPCCMTMVFSFDSLDTPYAYFLAHFGLFFAYFLAPQPMLSYIILL